VSSPPPLWRVVTSHLIRLWRGRGETANGTHVTNLCRRFILRPAFGGGMTGPGTVMRVVNVDCRWQPFFVGNAADVNRRGSST
jgi:hypothetical protein